MNNLNNSNLEETIINAFQEILQKDPNFFLTDRLNILTWKSKKIENALITKVGNLRYLGMLRKDSKGQEYWKYKPLTNAENSGGEQSSAFQTNSALKEVKQVSQSVEQSPEVKKFREKHGNPNTKESTQ